MSKQPLNSERLLWASCQALMEQEPLLPYDLDKLFADLRVRRMVGELIVRAANEPLA
jgi:hypothetical protein